MFLTAGGLVTETGAVMAHGPTVARGYGIPAVICVPCATETSPPCTEPRRGRGSPRCGRGRSGFGGRRSPGPPGRACRR
ncbi:PEP-utilizing enzyme [Streptomyces spinoverrucosus]|uniref:PEP-utilizing enzyme n=1 Tax=Streptomyces spinoverrucosus TaxID=284043 RepID=UPI0035AFF0E0